MQTVNFPFTRCRFGVASRDVTPPVGIYHRSWGAAAHDAAEGVHRPYVATAAVLSPTASIEALPPPATKFVYTGIMPSGTVLGTWAYQSCKAEGLHEAETL